MSDGRNIEVERHKLIRLYSEMLAVAHKHVGDMQITEDSGREWNEVRIEVRAMRRYMQDMRSKRRPLATIRHSFRQRVKRRTIDLIEAILETSSHRSRNKTQVHFGKDVVGYRRKKDSYSIFEIHVGWMWKFKVWDQLYMSADFGPWLILSADKVKVNHRFIDVYEVKAFHRDTGDTSDGYVAVTKTKTRKSFFGLYAAKAIKQADAEVQAQLNEALKGTEHD